MWKRTDALSERVKFILEWERRWQASQGRLDVAELSRLYGVSRQTVHVWIKHYQAAGHDLRVMQDRCRAPKAWHDRGTQASARCVHLRHVCAAVC